MRSYIAVILSALFSTSTLFALPPDNSVTEHKIELLVQEIQQLRDEVERQAHLLKQLSRTQEELFADLDKRLQAQRALLGKAATPDTEITSVAALMENPPSLAVVTVEEEEAYRAAYALLEARDYGAALVAMQEFIVRYPDGKHTANALYWVGELNMLENKWEEAEHAFSRVIDRHPTHAQAPDSLLKLGYIAYSKGKYPEARTLLEDVKRRYPDTTPARLADSRLEKMREEGNVP